jgi:hypothetical protein
MARLDKDNIMFSREVLRIAFKNGFKRWMPMTEMEKVDPNLAMTRLKQHQLFFCNHNPKFEIPAGSKIYTIGSCFARNVEKVLLESGMNVLGMDFSVDQDVLLDTVGVLANKVNDRSWINKYNTHAILGDLESGLDALDLPDRGFVSLGPDSWIDPQLAAVVKPLPFERLSKLRDRVNKLTLQVLEADLVFITLGLNEVWRDKYTGAYLNSSPPPTLMRNDNSRFEFLRPSFADAVLSLSRAIDLVRRKSLKDVKFILTVSPVPMGTTWTAEDVVVANSYSKATLRTVAGELADRHEFVDYFPSYEIVVNSPRDLAWQRDELHVAPEVVTHIMDIFKTAYLRVD